MKGGEGSWGRMTFRYGKSVTWGKRVENQFYIIKVREDLIGICYVHIVWNIHFEAVNLRKEEKGSGGE